MKSALRLGVVCAVLVVVAGASTEARAVSPARDTHAAEVQAEPHTQHLFVREGSEDGDGSVAFPYGGLSEALDAVAAYRLDGGTARVVVHVGAGTYDEQVKLLPGVHDHVFIKGETLWNVDDEGRLDSVRSKETRISFQTQADDPQKSGEAGDGKAWVVWVQASDVTLQDLVIESRGFAGPPSSTVALTLDRTRGSVLRRVWARGGFVRILARASEVRFDRTLTTPGGHPPRVGTAVQGGVEADGLGGRYVLDRCASRGMGNAFQISAHENRFHPDVMAPVGLEDNEVELHDCLAQDSGSGIQVIAHLPTDVSDSRNEGHLLLDVEDCTVRNNAIGLGVFPDNFGFTTGVLGETARTTMEVSLAGVSIVGSTAIDAFAGGAGADYLTVEISDPEGAAASIPTPDGHAGWITGSQLYYNDELVAPTAD